MEAERIDRLGTIAWHGYSRYVQEIKRERTNTSERAEVFTYNAVEMSDGCGVRINYLV